MKTLLDTHALLWLITSDKRLSKTAKDIFLNQENRLFFSITSLWEICIKMSLRKLYYTHLVIGKIETGSTQGQPHEYRFTKKNCFHRTL